MSWSSPSWFHSTTCYHLSQITANQYCTLGNEYFRSVIWCNLASLVMVSITIILQTVQNQCFQHADTLCTGNPPDSFGQKHVRHYRNVMFTRLCETINSRKCAAMNCKESVSDTSWVLCDNCLLWHHFECEHIVNKPDGYYFCAMCKSCFALP